MKRLFQHVGFWFLVNLVAFLVVVYVHFFTAIQTHQSWWIEFYYLVSNLLIGGLVSFLFYFLVVRLPESRKRNVIKKNISILYRNIKLSILWAIVFASQKGGRNDLSTDTEFVESLLDVSVFRETFKHGKQSDEGYYAFENQMSEKTDEFDDILLNLGFLQKQIEFILHNYTIVDQNVFDRLKRIELHMMRLRNTVPGYDGSKPLCAFLWEMCSGWNMIDGYQDHDPIEKLIESI